MRSLVLLCFVAAPLLEAQVKNVLVYREPGRFGGWPANHGIWIWGNEILVGYSAAWFEATKDDRHAMNRSKPEEPRLARSLDGGDTWQWEIPRGLLPPEQGGRAPTDLPAALDFQAPGFVMTIRFTNIHTGPSHLYFSYDKGKTWSGPHKFPLFGQKGVAARTDYIVNGRRDCLVFLTASKANGREGRPFAARTTDGGKTWKFVSWIGDEPAGFAIMPSTVRLGPRALLTTIRHKEEPENWIDAYRSDDDGASWKWLGKAADTGKASGNPPSTVRLRDGRIVMTYGYRDVPASMRARVSADGGTTWGPVIKLREDGDAWDIGYPRSVQRADGKVVTVYYFTDDRNTERFIAASIWEP